VAQCSTYEVLGAGASLLACDTLESRIILPRTLLNTSNPAIWVERKIRHRWLSNPSAVELHASRPRVMVGLGEEAVDGGLQVDDGLEDAALEPSLG
jgi:hypothetical protein